MPIIYPNDTVLQRWNGALEARLRRAPLEQFLRAKGLALAPAGRTQLDNDLLSATTFIVEKILEQRPALVAATARAEWQAAVGHLACVVSRALAAAVSEPSAWRVAALQCTARVLRAQSGSIASAKAAASLVRAHQRNLARPLSEGNMEIISDVCALLRETSQSSAVAGNEIASLPGRYAAARS